MVRQGEESWLEILAASSGRAVFSHDIEWSFLQLEKIGKRTLDRIRVRRKGLSNPKLVHK